MENSDVNKISKYLKGVAKSLERLAIEIEARKNFDKDDQNVMKKISSGLLYQAVAIDFKFDKLEEN